MILKRIKIRLSWIIKLLMMLLKVLNENLMVRMNIQILIFVNNLISRRLLGPRISTS